MVGKLGDLVQTRFLDSKFSEYFTRIVFQGQVSVLSNHMANYIS
jgi:hypothetical protein